MMGAATGPPGEVPAPRSEAGTTNQNVDEHDTRIVPPTGTTVPPETVVMVPMTTTTDEMVVSSQQVSWWSVHEYVAPQLAAVASWPMVGTPAWCALDDDDPAKLAALLDAAQHHALRVETAQEARCAASQAISAAEDWDEVSRRNYVYECFIAANPWAKRVTA